MSVSVAPFTRSCSAALPHELPLCNVDILLSKYLYSVKKLVLNFDLTRVKITARKRHHSVRSGLAKNILLRGLDLHFFLLDLI